MVYFLKVDWLKINVEGQIHEVVEGHTSKSYQGQSLVLVGSSEDR